MKRFLLLVYFILWLAPVHWADAQTSPRPSSVSKKSKQRQRLSPAEVQKIYFALNVNDDPALLKPLLHSKWTLADDNDKTLLPSMAQMGRWNCVRWLIKHGYSVNSSDELGRTALWHACGTNNIPTIKFLLDSGGDVNKQAIWNDLVTPLSNAVLSERYAAVEYLLKRKRYTKQTLEDALFLAAIRGLNKSIRLLYKARVDLNASNDSSHPLILAAVNANRSTVRLLLELGADPDVKSEEGSPVEHMWRGGGDISALVKHYCQKKRTKIQRNLKSTPTLTRR